MLSGEAVNLDLSILSTDSRFIEQYVYIDCKHRTGCAVFLGRTRPMWRIPVNGRFEHAAARQIDLLPRRRNLPLQLLVCALGILVLPGCTMLGGSSFSEWWKNGWKVGPNYARPAAAVANDWIDAADPRLRRECIDYSYWWRQFNDPLLDSLVQRATNQNLTLRAAGFQIMEARARRQIAAGSLFPQLQQATADYQRINISSRIANPPPVLDFDDWDVGFDVAWELDVWGRFRRAIEEQDARLDASIEDYDDFLVILQAEVALTYVQIRTFQERIRYATQNASGQEQLYNLTVIRQREGAVSDLDVQQAANIWHTTAATIPSLEAGLRQSQNALAVLLGVPPYDMTVELNGGPIPLAPREVVVGIPAALLSRRPDVRRAEREVAAQSARIGLAASDLYPTVTILGSLGWNAEDVDDLFTSEAFRGNVGPSFRWNILNYGRIRNNVVAQDARFQSLIAEYEQTVLAANAEAEDAIIAFLKSQAELAETQLAATAAERALTLSVTQYREGATDYARVLLATDFLTDSQDQLALSQANVATSLIQVYRALGGGWMTRLTMPNIDADVEPIMEGDEVLPDQIEALPPPAGAPSLILPPAA
jgi:NodT family efflux transporter outer membrane factor (OMF) lipoprotein